MTADSLVPPPVMTAHFVVPNDITGRRGEGLISEIHLASCLEVGFFKCWLVLALDTDKHNYQFGKKVLKKTVLVAMCQSVMVYLERITTENNVRSVSVQSGKVTFSARNFSVLTASEYNV